MGDEIYSKAAQWLSKPEKKIRKSCEGIKFTLEGDVIEAHSPSGNDYIIKKGKDKRVYCNCPGWVFSARQTKFGMCKHMIEAAAQDVLSAWEVGLEMTKMANEMTKLVDED